MNKVLAILNVPLIEKKYEVYIPVNKRIYDLSFLLAKAITEITDGVYPTRGIYALYDSSNGSLYDINLTVKESNIRNGSEIILI